MKIKSMFYPLLLSAAAVVFFINCSGNKKEEHAGHSEHATEDSTEQNAIEEISKPQFHVDEKFQAQLGSVFTSYVALKDAFVASNATTVKDKAKQTNETLANVDITLLSGAAHNDWMNYQASIQRSLTEIQATTNLEAQRRAFSNLSDNLYKSFKAFGLGGKEAFYEYCPMAFNNEGAYWLSDQSQIKNPYFGNKMLTCGEVKERIK